MGSFEVAVFTTSDLYWDCSSEFGDGYEARDIAAEFIEGAFSRSTNHTVTVLKPDTRVSAPQEQINDSFKAQPRVRAQLAHGRISGIGGITGSTTRPAKILTPKLRTATCC